MTEGFIDLHFRSEMSCSYAEGLSEYHDKGKLGLPEKFDLEDEIRDKVETLTQWIREARHIVVHTGGSGEKCTIHIHFNPASFFENKQYPEEAK